MDAVEFLKERKRLCSSYKGCVGCPFGAAECVVRDMTSEHTCKRIVTAVEQWSKEHQRKTRQSVFLEQWPDAIISSDGLPQVAPCQLCVGLVHGKFTEDCESRGLCAKCRREFWMQEVENE